MRTLTPDVDAARRQLHALTGERDPVVAWQLFSDSDKNNRRLARGFHGRLGDVLSDLTEAQRRGCGVYIAVNATDGTGRKAANMCHARAVFLDLDGTPLPKSWPAEPHLIVHSSSVGGTDKFQCWWMLEMNNDWDRWMRAQKAMALRYGGDLKCCMVTQVARLAGFWHLKRPESPWRVRILHDAGNVARQTLDDLVETFGFDLSAIKLPAASQRDRIDRPPPPHGWDADLDVIVARGLVADPDAWTTTSDGGVSIFQMACRLRDLGISEALAVDLIRENVPVYPDSWPDDHVERKTRHAYRYGQNAAGVNSIEGDRRALTAAFADEQVLRRIEAEQQAKGAAMFGNGKGGGHA